MQYPDRAEAGRQLAGRLMGFSGREHAVVLGLPRGGMAVAAGLAGVLRLPLDVLLARKLGVPGHEEQAFGAVAAEDGVHLEQEIVRRLGITQEQISDAIDRTRAELRQEADLYRSHCPALPLRGEIVILTDDGSATGAGLISGVQALRRMEPAQLVLALPVAPEPICALLERKVDLLIVLQRPPTFFAVRHFYANFQDVSVADVLRLMGAGERRACSAGVLDRVICLPKPPF